MDNGSGVPADQLEQVQKTMREGNDDPEAEISGLFPISILKPFP